MLSANFFKVSNEPKGSEEKKRGGARCENNRKLREFKVFCVIRENSRGPARLS